MRRLPPLLLLALLAPAGAAQIYETQPSWLEPGTFYGNFGRRVTLADTNGDGLADAVIAGPFYTDQSPSAFQFGAVLVYPGTANGLSESYTWAETGPNQGTTLGWHVDAGDIDADGYEDIVFSSGSGFGNGTHAVHVRFGGDHGPQAAWNYDTGMLFGALGPTLAVGDLNGDGFDDVVAGFTHMDGGAGRLVAFFGSAAGLPAVPDWELTGVGTQNLGYGLAIVGDVDDDGYEDLVACAYPDELRLYLGSPGGPGSAHDWSRVDPRLTCQEGEGLSAAGDVDADGFDDFVVAAEQLGAAGADDGLALFRGSASGPAAEYWQIVIGPESLGLAATAAGDVNGDGFDDVVASAPLDGDAGRVFLYLGSPVGFQPQPAWSGEAAPQSVVIGWSVAAGRDVDGDGLTDLLAGDPSGNLQLFGWGTLYRGTQPLIGGPPGLLDPPQSVLTLARGGAGQVVLLWSASCFPGPEDYALYRGDLGEFTSHVPVTCSTGGLTTWAVTSGGGDRYYLVVPRSLDAEGSYGAAGDGSERPPSAASCLPQSAPACP